MAGEADPVHLLSLLPLCAPGRGGEMEAIRAPWVAAEMDPTGLRTGPSHQSGGSRCAAFYERLWSLCVTGPFQLFGVTQKVDATWWWPSGAPPLNVGGRGCILGGFRGCASADAASCPFWCRCPGCSCWGCCTAAPFTHAPPRLSPVTDGSACEGQVEMKNGCLPLVTGKAPGCRPEKPRGAELTLLSMAPKAFLRPFGPGALRSPRAAIALTGFQSVMGSCRKSFHLMTHCISCMPST